MGSIKINQFLKISIICILISLSILNNKTYIKNYYCADGVAHSSVT